MRVAPLVEAIDPRTSRAGFSVAATQILRDTLRELPGLKAYRHGVNFLGMVVMETAQARQRVLLALKALMEYVNRPLSEPHDEKVFNYLSREFRKAAGYYNELLGTAGGSDHQNVA